ncbi:MAG: cell division protein FtsQ [Lachnospiraceae bacterium]|jgi:cell division protein FtsQ|nr:cell division protein FtsQ [Lachnospiraceae bacterium]
MSKKQKRQKSIPKRLFLKAIGILFFLGIPALIFASTFRLQNITVKGVTRYTPEEIQGKIIQTRWDNNSLLLYLKMKYFTEINIPFIEDVDLALVDNHSVNILVYEKKVTGCVEFLGEYLYFDKDGIVVESSAKRLEDIPQIKGLRFNKVILHEKLDVQKSDLFDVILNLTQIIDKYEMDIDTISFNSKYEVTVDCGDIRVQLGKRSTYDEILAELKNILAEVKGKQLTLDMRKFEKDTDSIIAKPKPSR